MFPLMFPARGGHTLANMSEIDPWNTALVNWSDLGVNGLLPTGTATLLLADVEGSTRLWGTQTEEMRAAFATLWLTNRIVGITTAQGYGEAAIHSPSPIAVRPYRPYAPPSTISSARDFRWRWAFQRRVFW